MNPEAEISGEEDLHTRTWSPKGSGPRFMILAASIAFFLLPVVAHIFLSPLGFNPTDDGWVLAGARQVLDGRIPHRDILSPHILGSHYLHAPFTLLGDHVLWSSRAFVWLQLGAIAWMWSGIMGREPSAQLRPVHRLLLSVVGVIFTVHLFPIMAWTSTDAILATVIGAWLIDGRNHRSLSGYLVLGMAPLFRQNFSLVVPGVILLLGDWRKLRNWLLAAIPSALYVLAVALSGGAQDLWDQLTAFTLRETLRFGFSNYLSSVAMWVGVLIATLAALWADHKAHRMVRRRWLGAGILIAVPAVWGVVMGMRGWSYIYGPSFLLFGMGLGGVGGQLLRTRSLSPQIRHGFTALLIAWAVSMSLGYNTPALGLGLVVMYLLDIARSASLGEASGHPTPAWARGGPRSLVSLALALSTAVAAVTFVYARRTFVYRDLPARGLTAALGEVLPGGAGIRTNPRTYDFLRDLQEAKHLVRNLGREYAILPDVAVNWATDPQPNPLPVNWPLDSELPLPELKARVTQELESQRGDIVVLVQKYEAPLLPGGLYPLTDGIYWIVEHVESRWRRVGETGFFELYE
ncbi:MAG TPA: hypothetical protein VFA00_05870 [Actinomycetota bacterium]|nr:hypothetical protein [Actinomycetota bacterium]